MKSSAAVRKIVTITLNTALDRVVRTPRPQSTAPLEILFPAGKGVNVARTVEALGENVFVLGLVGVAARPLFDALRSPLFHVLLTDIQGETRKNVTVFDAIMKTTTHTRTDGFRVTADDLVRFHQIMQNTVTGGDIVVVSGSLPPSVNVSTYRNMITDLNSQGVQTILDSSGDELAEGIAGKPFMVKPNLQELESLVGKTLTTESMIVGAAQQIRDSGIHLVVVSRGSEGVIVVSDIQESVLKANVAVKEEHSLTGSVGSGDALVGGFAVGLLKGLQLNDVVRLGVACGAANLLADGPGVCRRADIDRILPQVQLSTIDSVT